MGIKEFLDAIGELTGTNFYDAIVLPSANKTIASFKQRIFNRGEDTNSNKIGQYSKKPISIGYSQFAKKSAFKPNGKKASSIITKKQIVVNSDGDEQTMYFAGGYKEFREVQGRQTNYVDARLSGSLEASIQLVKKDDGTILIVITNNYEATKAKNVEKIFDKEIFALSTNEKEIYVSEITENSASAISKIFG